MISDAKDEWKPMPSSIYLYVNDTDAAYKRSVQTGASSITEPADQFYGDRSAYVKDPVGNFWWIATHKEGPTFRGNEEASGGVYEETTKGLNKKHNA